EETVLFSYEGHFGRRANRVRFSGAIEFVRRRHSESTSDVQRQELEAYMSPVPCESCGGKRLRRESLAVTVGEVSIAALTELSVQQALHFVRGIQLREIEQMIARDILKEIGERLGFLDSVGLGYLTLNRAAASLSGGEAQRIRLATQIGSGLGGGA
ncbi:excinuclease ABC, A subunit, partial [mine drainage metagenome]